MEEAQIQQVQTLKFNSITMVLSEPMAISFTQAVDKSLWRELLVKVMPNQLHSFMADGLVHDYNPTAQAAGPAIRPIPGDPNNINCVEWGWIIMKAPGNPGEVLYIPAWQGSPTVR